MTNKIGAIAIKLGKLLLIIILIIIGLAILTTFLKFSEIEKRLSKDKIDYSKLLNPQYTSPQTATAPNTKNNSSQLILGNENNYSLGSDNAKLTIVEFADFACPYCKKSFPKIREISLKYNKDIKYIFRDLPIISEHSANLALGARCAGEQGLFWPMHDRLFMDQGIKEDAEIWLAAKQSGVDTSKFEACYDTQKYLPQIKKDFSDAQALGIDHIGTPVWFVNGQQVSGDIPEDVFNKIIEDILNK